MGAMYDLYNFTKRERVGCHRLGATTRNEHLYKSACGAVVLWYLFGHAGDKLAFVSDYDAQAGREFFGEVTSYAMLAEFVDKTDETVASAIEAKVLEDHGFLFRDEDEPDTVYVRDLRVSKVEPQIPHDSDGDALRRIIQSGSSLDRPMLVDFQVAAPSQQVADEIAKACFALGYRVSVSADVGSTFTVTCATRLLVSYAAVVAIQDELARVVMPLGGKPDGWGTFGNGA